MRIAQQAELIKAHFVPWMEQLGGAVYIASDLVHLYKLAANTTQSPRLAVFFEGEVCSRGDDSVSAYLGRVDRSWWVMVSRGRGFNAERGDSLTKTVQNSPPLYTLVEQARDIIRTMLDVSVELPVDYKGIEPVPARSEQEIVDAYLIKFMLASDLPVPQAEPEGNVDLEDYASQWGIALQEEQVWRSIDASYDGSDVIVCTTSGAVNYKSNNTGGSWDSIGGVFMSDVAVAPDGDTMVYARGAVGAEAFYSDDGGENFSQSSISPVSRFFSTMDAADSLIVAGGSDFNYVFRSTDGGANYTTPLQVVNGCVAPVHGSALSTAAIGYVMFTGNSSARIYKSTDSGTTWNALGASNGLGMTNGLACSADGSKIVVGCGTSLKLSTNGGTSFTTILTGGLIGDVSMSEDGEVILVSFSTGSPQISTDGGDTWTEITEVPEGNYPTCAVSGNGLVRYLCLSGGYIYKQVTT